MSGPGQHQFKLLPEPSSLVHPKGALFQLQVFGRRAHDWTTGLFTVTLHR